VSYDAFIDSLAGEAPPADAELALRALWYDARGRAESAIRAAEAGNDHACKRVRAYLCRKAGDVHGARLWYWRSGASPWSGTPQSEWEDIVKTVLAERVVTNAYS
jgi:hypothetical protein